MIVLPSLVFVGLVAAGGMAMLHPWEVDTEFPPECAAHMGEPTGYTRDGWPEYRWQGFEDEMAVCDAALKSTHDEATEDKTVDELLAGEVEYAFTLEGPPRYIPEGIDFDGVETTEF